MTLQASNAGDGPLLVVDDDVYIREILQAILRDEGYAVEVCCDGQEAIRRVAEPPTPVLVLLDLGLPVRSGWEVLDCLVRAPFVPGQVPVVIVSAAGLERRAELLRRGASAVLDKPIGLAELLSTIAEVLPARRGEAPRASTRRNSTHQGRAARGRLR
jgi:CheY-like chemotaxis protein